MVLVVDDFKDVCYILQRMLEREGLYVLCANDTYEAERLLKDVTPSVIVLDDSMPGRSGLEFLRQIKSDPALANIAVLMFSASADAGRMDEARKIGAEDWRVKGTVSWNELVEKIVTLHQDHASDWSSARIKPL